MAIIINAVKNVSYYAYGEMMTKLRPAKKEAATQETPALSAKKDEVKPVELSKKEEVKAPELSKKEGNIVVATLAPEAEVESLALSPASEPVAEVLPEETVSEEQTEAQTQEDLEIVVKSDELVTQSASVVGSGSIQTEDEMDYNGDGEVTIDERMRYLEEQSKANSLPQMTIENNKVEKPETPEVKTAEAPEVKKPEILAQNNTFAQNQLTGVQKFNYNNLQKAYMAKPQAQSSLINRAA